MAIRAVDAGKHVLCEKPIAISANEARSMFNAARSNHRHLAEAYPYLAQEQTIRMRELIAAGGVGSIRVIRASFGVHFTDRNNVRFNPSLGGGALLDAGCYAVSFVRAVAERRPKRVHAIAKFENGVDVTTMATLEFDNDLLAQVSCSFQTGFHRHAIIAGDRGVIETNFLNHPPIGGAPAFRVRRTATLPTAANPELYETIETSGGSGFRLEAESFADLVAGAQGAWQVPQRMSRSIS